LTTKISTSTPGAILQIYSGYLDDQISAQPLLELANKDALTLSLLGSSVIPTVSLGKKILSLEKNKGFTIRWSGTRYLAGVDGIVSVAQLGTSKKYRYGQIQVRAVKDATLGYRLELTNSLRLGDEYLWGVSEMQSSWPAAALEAQAIASRTYALSKVGVYKTGCDCEIYGDSSDQNFAGYVKEIEPRYGPLWKSAVIQSAGITITQDGRPITPYFFSSSGGKTELSVNAWGGAKAYTQIVDDPGSLDISLNPRYVSWDRTVTQSVVAAAFLLRDVVSLEILSRNASGTIGRIRATSSTGEQFTLRGESFRSRAKIPSAYCDLVSVQN
jgi:SpoIID/LytB domain protein